MDSASLRVDIEKNVFCFGFEVFWGERHKYGYFVLFWHLCLALGAVPMGHFLDSKFS